MKHPWNKPDYWGFVWIVLGELKSHLESTWEVYISLVSLAISEICRSNRYSRKILPPSHGVSSGLQRQQRNSFTQPCFEGYWRDKQKLQKHKKCIEIFTRRSQHSNAWYCYLVELHLYPQEDLSAVSWNPTLVSFLLELSLLEKQDCIETWRISS